MASLQTVYGSPPSSSYPTGVTGMSNFSFAPMDATPQAEGLMLLFWAGVLWLLKYYGFRFNFGVAGGK